MAVLRPLVIFAVLVAVWQLAVWLSGMPHFLLPGPGRVAGVLVARWPALLENGLVTAAEILLGLLVGTTLGCLSALSLTLVPPLRRWLLPILVVSQAIPVFALAPLLVLWFGYGLGPKIAMASLIIYFPVTAAFYDGLRRTEPGWLDLAQTMGGSRLSALLRVRLPAALPALASGLRVAAATAPIGAVVGEWVGSGAGLGRMMLDANGRMQTDVMFAALFVLALLALSIYTAVDRGCRAAVPWAPERP
jgi:putative hydroxymethylpyrimidine transport system permease protein